MDLVVKIHGEDTLTPTLKKVKSELDGVGPSAAKLEQIRAKFEKITASAQPLKKRLAETKKLMAEMNLDGLSNTDVFLQLAQQAGAYSDALGDASTAVKQFANDNRGLKACIEGMSALTGVVGAATGAMNLLGIENENVEQAMLKVQSVTAVLNSLQAVANALNKDSAFMLTIKSAATAGATVTTGALTAALSKQAIVEALVTAKQKIATAAQVAWNVAKAIGMAMLGNFTGLALLAVGAVVGLTVAISSDTDETEKNNEAKERANKVAEKVRETQTKCNDDISSSTAKLLASYRGLQTQWNSLKTEQQKTQFIEDNKSKFSELGVSVDDVSTAEDFFVKSSSKVIAALKARAKAAAYYNNYVEALQQKYKLDQRQTATMNRVNKKGEKDAEGNKWSFEGTDKVYDTLQEARDAYNKYVADQRAAANQAVSYVENCYLESQRIADEATNAVDQFKPKQVSTSKPKGGSSSSGSQRISASQDDTSLDFAQRMVSQLEDDIKKTPTHAKEKIAEVNAELDKWKKTVEARKLIITPEVTLPEGSLEYAEAMLTKAKAALNSVDLDIISEEDLKKAKEQVEEWEKKVEEREIKLGIKVVEPEEPIPTITVKPANTQYSKGSDEDKRASYQNAQSMVSQLQSDVKIGVVGGDEALSKIAEINAQLETLGLTPFNFTINADTGQLEEAMSEVEASQKKLAKMQDDISKFQDAFGNFGSSISSIGSLLDEDSSKMADFAASTITAIAQMLPQLLALFGQEAAVAMVSGVKGASSLPFPASLAAIATVVATLTGVIASAAKLKSKKYASGGIVGGATTIGDYNLARVNSGEMILNNRQQSRLFHMLNSGATIENGNPSYTVKIKGSDLHLALSNYAKTKKNIL